MSRRFKISPEGVSRGMQDVLRTYLQARQVKESDRRLEIDERDEVRRESARKTDDLSKLGAPLETIEMGARAALRRSSGAEGPAEVGEDHAIEKYDALQKRLNNRGARSGVNPLALKPEQIRLRMKDIETANYGNIEDAPDDARAEYFQLQGLWKDIQKTSYPNAPTTTTPTKKVEEPKKEGGFKSFLRGAGNMAGKAAMAYVSSKAPSGMLKKENTPAPAAPAPADDGKVTVMKDGKKFRLPKGQLRQALDEGYSEVK